MQDITVGCRINGDNRKNLTPIFWGQDVLDVREMCYDYITKKDDGAKFVIFDVDPWRGKASKKYRGMVYATFDWPRPEGPYHPDWNPRSKTVKVWWDSEDRKYQIDSRGRKKR